MTIRFRTPLERGAALVASLTVASALSVPQPRPPHFDSGSGLTVVSQPAWVDLPNTARNQRITERATQEAPLITVWPNGGGRSWYSDWVNPGALGPQNWETFHLDQVIPLIDANLRTIPTRDGRAIVGHSMGGFGAFHYAEHRPDLFSYVGSFSGGLGLLSPARRVAARHGGGHVRRQRR